MYVRDHCRPAFHAAIGMHPDDYDFKVLRLTTEISRQVFPITLDLDHPLFKPGLDRLVAIERAIATAKTAEAAIVARAKQACADRGRGGDLRAALFPAGEIQRAAGANSSCAGVVRSAACPTMHRRSSRRSCSGGRAPACCSISTVSLAAPSCGAWRARRRFSRWRYGASSRRAAKRRPPPPTTPSLAD